jgi:hypothetical protein
MKTIAIAVSVFLSMCLMLPLQATQRTVLIEGIQRTG